MLQVRARRVGWDVSGRGGFGWDVYGQWKAELEGAGGKGNKLCGRQGGVATSTAMGASGGCGHTNAGDSGMRTAGGLWVLTAPSILLRHASLIPPFTCTNKRLPWRPHPSPLIPSPPLLPRCPLVMPPELLQDLAEYKKFRDREVASAARGLIGLFRDINPGEGGRRVGGGVWEWAGDREMKRVGGLADRRQGRVTAPPGGTAFLEPDS